MKGLDLIKLKRERQDAREGEKYFRNRNIELQSELHMAKAEIKALNVLIDDLRAQETKVLNRDQFIQKYVLNRSSTSTPGGIDGKRGRIGQALDAFRADAPLLQTIAPE